MEGHFSLLCPITLKKRVYHEGAICFGIVYLLGIKLEIALICCATPLIGRLCDIGLFAFGFVQSESSSHDSWVWVGHVTMETVK